MLSNDFYGRQGFIWFTGIVEDVNDPAQLGQVRVRIIGLHSEDKALAPTESLPWAQVSMAPTSAKTHSGPIVGDWVWGFFQDGEFAQIPVITGVFPGVEGKQSQIIHKYQEEVKGANYYPKTSQHHRQVGEGTTFRSVRGVIDGTLTQVNNTLLSTSCGIGPQVKTALAWARLQSSIIIKQLVVAIKALAASLGADPSGLVSFAISVVKHIKNLVDWIKDILDVIRDWTQVISEVVQVCRRIVNFILNLPARLQAFLQNCLKYFLGEISSFIAGILGQIGGAIFSSVPGDLVKEISDLNRSINDSINIVNDIEDNVSNTVENVEGIESDVALALDRTQGILNPTSLSEQNQSVIYLNSYIQNVANNSETLTATTIYTEFKYATP